MSFWRKRRRRRVVKMKRMWMTWRESPPIGNWRKTWTPAWRRSNAPEVEEERPISGARLLWRGWWGKPEEQFWADPIKRRKKKVVAGEWEVEGKGP